MLNNSQKDIILFDKIKKSDQIAFNELFITYYKELCDFSNLIINNKFLAEEIVADVFALIWINRKKIKIKKSVKAYLYRSTRNTTISYIRKNKHIFDEIVEEKLNIFIPDYSPEHIIDEEEIKNKTEKLLSVIPYRSREIFILHRFNDFKYKDIAEMLDISIKTVEKHISKALKLLRENYKKIYK